MGVMITNNHSHHLNQLSLAVLHEELCVKDDQPVHNRHGKNANGRFITATINKNGKEHNVGNKA